MSPIRPFVQYLFERVPFAQVIATGLSARCAMADEENFIA